MATPIHQSRVNPGDTVPATQPPDTVSNTVKLILVFVAGVALASRVKALPVIGPIIPTI